MTTAREKLYEEMIAMIVVAAGPTSESEVRKTMTRYRVQTKPGVDIPPGATARDALGDRLLELWRGDANGQAPDVKAKIGTAIDEFRMQLKGSSPPSPPGGGAPRSPGSPRAAGLSDVLHDAGVAALPRIVGLAGMPQALARGGEAEPGPRERRTATEPRRDPGPGRPSVPGAAEALGASDPPTAAMRGRAGRSGAEAVAGGPRKRGRTRGECPKCHSMGVVLARSYSGDEYFSCIYCGWQAYKPTDENDPNASLAVRLLGQAPTETTRE